MREREHEREDRREERRGSREVVTNGAGGGSNGYRKGEHWPSGAPLVYFHAGHVC